MKTTSANMTTARPPVKSRLKKLLRFMQRFHRVNDRLPTNSEIGKEFEVWKTVVPRWLTALEKAGDIEKSPAGGWRFVRAKTPETRGQNQEGEPMFAATIELTALDVESGERVLRLLADEMDKRPDAQEWECGDVEGHAVANLVVP